jgi:alkylation response protein AidB-like acyl-CoA dehydrogenase
MRPAYSLTAEAFRNKVRSFLEEHVPQGWRGFGALPLEEAEQFYASWRTKLYEHGLLAVHWPVRYGGGGLGFAEHVVLAEELARARMPYGTDNDAFGLQMLGNSLLEWGTDAQKERFLPAILSGEHVWCQGYSEPNAGSDLANIGCHAVLDGDEWVLNGQKIWTSGAHRANWIFAIVRTDRSATKHRGLSFLLVPIDQPGVEVRPIANMAGEHDFNEVYFTDARTAADLVVGDVNGGWAVAMTLLGYERGEAAAIAPIRYQVELDRLLALAVDRGRAADPVIRQRLASCYAQVKIMRLNGWRALTRYLRGQPPGPDAATFKLYWSEYHRQVTELAVDIVGIESTTPSGRPPSDWIQTDDAGAPNSTASWTTTFLNARAGTIYGGSSQVQRNIIGELLLGLPKEPHPAAVDEQRAAGRITAGSGDR